MTAANAARTNTDQDGNRMMLAMFFLAVSDTIAIAQWVFNFLMAAGVAYIGNKTHRIEALETRLAVKTEELVKDRIEAHSSNLKSAIESLATQLQNVVERLKDGEAGFEKLGGRDQAIELAVAGKFDALKDYLRETMATKKDLERHQDRAEERAQSMTQTLVSMGNDIAVLKSQSKPPRSA